MTQQAVEAYRRVKADLDRLIADLTDDEWERASACEGWRVGDVIAHLGASAKEVIEPTIISTEDSPMPENRERQHDVLVDRRRSWARGQVIEEYEKFSDTLAERVADLQAEPLASRSVPLPGLGVYPMHAMANALAFDNYCHLRMDILGPSGPIARVLAEPDHDVVYPVVQWMMWGLPQMQGSDLDGLVVAPITIELTGPGASTWTVSRTDRSPGLVVEECSGGAVTVISAAHDFVAWGTQRRAWQDHSKIIGDPAVAAPFLIALNII